MCGPAVGHVHGVVLPVASDGRDGGLRVHRTLRRRDHLPLEVQPRRRLAAESLTFIQDFIREVLD